jgi:hypothetical protein
MPVVHWPCHLYLWLQVVIKLNSSEPESLVGDIMSRSSAVLQHRG